MNLNSKNIQNIPPQKRPTGSALPSFQRFPVKPGSFSISRSSTVLSTEELLPSQVTTTSLRPMLIKNSFLLPSTGTNSETGPPPKKLIE